MYDLKKYKGCVQHILNMDKNSIIEGMKCTKKHIVGLDLYKKEIFPEKHRRKI